MVYMLIVDPVLVTVDDVESIGSVSWGASSSPIWVYFYEAKKKFVAWEGHEFNRCFKYFDDIADVFIHYAHQGWVSYASAYEREFERAKEKAKIYSRYEESGLDFTLIE